MSTSVISMSEKSAAAAAAMTEKMHKQAMEKAAAAAEKEAAKEAKAAEKEAAKAAKAAEKEIAKAAKAAEKEVAKAEKEIVKAAKAAEKEAAKADKESNPKRPRGRPAKSSSTTSSVLSAEEDGTISESEGTRPDLFEPTHRVYDRVAILSRLQKAESAMASIRALLMA
jgi:hypothetical protein